MKTQTVIFNEEQLEALRELIRAGEVPETWIKSKVLNLGEGADVEFSEVVNSGVAFWMGFKVCQRTAKKCQYQRGSLNASETATMILSKFMYYGNDMTNELRYEMAVWSAKQHILEITTADLTPDELLFLMEITSALDNKLKKS